jgi:hypothetical protein
MSKQNVRGWRFDRHINLSIVVELLLLASLIIGSWINLQSQLGFLQRDVGMLIKKQEEFCGKIENINEKCISYEYRIRAVEGGR